MGYGFMISKNLKRIKPDNRLKNVMPCPAIATNIPATSSIMTYPGSFPSNARLFKTISETITKMRIKRG
jgi:hypothetical protein